MEKQEEVVENTPEQPVGWYVSRVVNLQSAQIRSIGLLGGIVTPSGAVLKIGDAIAPDRALEDHVSYQATLSFPGLISAKVKVELIVVRYAGTLAEIGLRPLERVPQRRVSAERYFDAAWAVLDGIARGEAARDADEGLAPRVRRLVKAS